MKSKNKRYVILTVIILVGLSFFFSTKYWLPDDRAIENSNYNESFSAGDWTLHVGDAQYDKAQSKLYCTINQMSQATSPKQYHITVFLGNPKLNNTLSYVLTEKNNDPDNAYLEVKNVPTDYYYLTVEITAPESLNPTNIDKADIQVDYRVATRISAAKS
jgi:hypothetical protein